MAEIQGYVDLSSRAKFRLSGGDRERYLNGQVTNDVRKATPDQALYACVTNAKGKLEADVFLSPTPEGDAFWIDGPGSLRETLFARLDRYIIADDAKLEDVTDQFELIHVLGESELELEGVWIRQANRYGIEGIDLIAPQGTSLSEQLSMDKLDSELLIELRIRHGIAAWDAELDDSTLPQEARLEDRAVDFEKGCYIGQEVISRIKSVGRVNRLLVALVCEESDLRLERGMELVSGEAKAGTISSAIYSPSLHRSIALAFIKRNHASPGTILKAGASKNNLSSSLEIRETPLT